jgi:hypothetical protein
MTNYNPIKPYQRPVDSNDGVTIKYLESELDKYARRTSPTILGNATISGSLTAGTISGTAISGTSGTFSGLFFPQQAVTASAPAYVKGAIYFDTTLNKLRVGGATAWETVTSS